jgi:CelD/BcsL family acetyltransferase involved in cellulose biosynthesis/RimJ/RimL family protein N-acetyltransferase
MKFQLLNGAAAQQWLKAENNQKAWWELQASCLWATPYLSPEFAQAWFRHYFSVWEPLLVIAIDNKGVLSGLLPLARKGNEIVGVGAQQAEYQGWLSSTADLGQFLDGALEILFHTWPSVHLRLRYIDVAHAVEHLLTWARSRDDIVLDTHARPLMKLDAKAIEAVLRKRSNRSKLNRLKRSGELVVKHDYLETDTTASLDEIIRLYDFRQGAANDSCPFVDDERKRAFHLDLLEQAPGHIIAFRMLLDGQTVAALLGVRGPHRISNAIFAYSPHHARHSPGKLLLYLAAQSMLSQEVDYLDLTPGGDPWKERFATHHDQVYELNVWGNVAQLRKYRWRNHLQAVIRKVLVEIGLPPSKLRNWLSRLRRVRPRSVWDTLQKILPRRTEYRIYRLDLDKLAELPAAAMMDTDLPLRINDLTDLVHFTPATTWQSRQRFLAEALNRIERGEQVYSARDDGALLHYGWLIREQNEAFFTEVGAEYRYPKPGAVLYDFFTHPDARGQGWYQRTLATMLRDLNKRSVADCGVRVVYVSVLADNKASRHVIEKLGFDYVESLIRVSAFGWSHCKQVFSDG